MTDFHESNSETNFNVVALSNSLSNSQSDILKDSLDKTPEHVQNIDYSSIIPPLSPEKQFTLCNNPGNLQETEIRNLDKRVLYFPFLL